MFCRTIEVSVFSAGYKIGLPHSMQPLVMTQQSISCTELNTNPGLDGYQLCGRDLPSPLGLSISSEMLQLGGERWVLHWYTRLAAIAKVPLISCKNTIIKLGHSLNHSPC